MRHQFINETDKCGKSPCDPINSPQNFARYASTATKNTEMYLILKKEVCMKPSLT